MLGHVRGLARDHVAVADIQERRCVAPAMQEAVRFAAYVAPLDKEQTVATVYAGPIGELQRWLPDSDPGSGLSLAPRSADRYWVST